MVTTFFATHAARMPAFLPITAPYIPVISNVPSERSNSMKPSRNSSWQSGGRRRTRWLAVLHVPCNTRNTPALLCIYKLGTTCIVMLDVFSWIIAGREKHAVESFRTVGDECIELNAEEKGGVVTRTRTDGRISRCLISQVAKCPSRALLRLLDKMPLISRRLTSKTVHVADSRACFCLQA